jgi:hypothetical protein
VFASRGPLAIVTSPPSEPGAPLRVTLERTAPDGTKQPLVEKEVVALCAAKFADLTHDGRANLVIAWTRAGSGPEVVALAVPSGGAPTALLDVEARGFVIADATGDGAPDLVVTATLGHPLASASVVYRAKDGKLERTLEGTDAFYAERMNDLRARITAPPKPGATDLDTNDRLLAMLDLALTLEVLGKKAEAFATYQALLDRAHVPTQVSREEAAARAGTIEIASEARLSLARLSGLRVAGEPRPSPASPAASPSPH